MKSLIPLIAFLFLILVCCCRNEDDLKTGRSTAVFNTFKTYGTVKDTDGNVYKTITLGTQTWMAENLRTTCYQNGDPIPNIKNGLDWGPLTTGAYCSFQNTTNRDSIANFGLLYNSWAAVDVRNIAPEGWHVPTDAEWDTLQNVVAGVEGGTTIYGNPVAGGKLMEAGSLHWGYANKADNSSGFTALPGGERSTYNNSETWSSEFRYIGSIGNYWTSTTINEMACLIRRMTTDFISITRSQSYNSFGYSIRCVKNK
jgi:uncharacterized protein (TIGR02145 family)